MEAYLVALRRRTVSETETTPASVPAAGEGGEGEGPSRSQGVGAAVTPTPTLSKPGETDGALQQRLRELQAAERAAAEHMRSQQELINSHLRIEKEQPQPPEFSQRDLEFLGSRPGIEKDQRFVQMAASLPSFGIHWNTPDFYRTLEAAFPVEHYRRVEQPKPEPDKAPAYAEEVEDQPPVSAPISGEVPSGGRYVPSASSYRLSPEEREIARASNMSEVDYARNRLRLEEMKRRGLVQDGDGR